MPPPRSYSWCFTENNPEPNCLVKLIEAAQYVIAGNEVGEEGTPHLQGYAYFYPLKKSLAQLKELLPRAHWEITKGTPEQAIEYCKKDGDWHEEGTPPMSRKRKGELGKEYWEEQLKIAKTGRIEECDAKLQITHDLALSRIAAKYAPKPTEIDVSDNHHQWFYGPTGTGKSRRARDDYPNYFDKSLNKWWCGYNNEEVALLDDFGKEHSILGSYLKRWADRYPFSAEIKGGKITIRPNRIVVTSNYHPKEIFEDPNVLNPILRRFHITHFN